ncbi:MAG: formyltransferase family protein [Colwellia sp.]
MRIALIGRSEILFNCAELLIDEGHEIGLIITAKEAPEYTKTSEGFREFSKLHKIDFLHSARLGDENSRQFIKLSGPIDVCVSVNYSGIIPQSIIDLFPLGILNAHGGDLPRYRGNACQAWALINGEKEIGLCVHKMIGGELDNGLIISRDYLSIDHNTKIGQCYSWMNSRIPNLFLESIGLLENDPDYVLEKQSTDPKDALRCYPRMPVDGKIDWHKGTLDILRLINASSEPFSGAFAEFEGESIIIWQAELLMDDEVFVAVAGQVMQVNPEIGYIVIATGDGKLKINEVEYRGRRVQPYRIINSIRKRLR